MSKRDVGAPPVRDAREASERAWMVYLHTNRGAWFGMLSTLAATRSASIARFDLGGQPYYEDERRKGRGKCVRVTITPEKPL